MFAVTFPFDKDAVIFPKAIFAPMVKQARESPPLITFLFKSGFFTVFKIQYVFYTYKTSQFRY